MKSRRGRKQAQITTNKKPQISVLICVSDKGVEYEKDPNCR